MVDSILLHNRAKRRTTVRMRGSVGLLFIFSSIQ
jgi:hypothetical protein